MSEDNTASLLTVAGVCERLNISRSVAYSLLNTGELRSFRIGRLRRISPQAVEDYVGRIPASRPSDGPEAA